MERVKEERSQTRRGGEMTRRPNTVASADQRGYRIVEAAEYMGVTPWFVEVKIRSGELPALKLCRHYTILKQDMDAFLDRHREALLDKHRSMFMRKASKSESRSAKPTSM
jgi:excisionase family DNA binding protein